MKHGFVKFGIGIGIGFKTFPIFLKVSDSVSEKGSDLVSKKNSKKSWICLFETWFCKIWYRYWYWFRNFSNFLDGIGFGIIKIWYQNKYRIRYRKKFGIEESIGFGKAISEAISND